MIIHVYSIMRDEEKILPYFLRHYSAFADKIFIMDDRSVDKTVEIARKNKKVKLLNFSKYQGGLHEEDHSRAFIESYQKHSRGVADWVMCVDADEFLYHYDIRPVLEQKKRQGHKIIKANGITVFSKKYPTTTGQIYEECNLGTRDRLYDKQVIFDPELDIQFTGGRHDTLSADGQHVPNHRCSILLLHFRYLDEASSLKKLARSRHGWDKHKLAIRRAQEKEKYRQGLKGARGPLFKIPL